MRARNIKPGFFKNEELAGCSPWARLLAAGLWMLADREGRLEDKPRQIKMEIFPADNVDCDPLLDELWKAGHIIRYECVDKKYIQVVKFLKHQNPHIKEKQSEIPEYIYKNQDSTVQALDSHQPKVGLHPLNPESLLLNPESGILNELSEDNSSDRSEKSEPPPSACSYAGIVKTWNEVCGEKLPKVIDITDARRKAMKARSSHAFKTLDEWRVYFKTISETDFLIGKNDKNWRADFDFALRPATVTKIKEGKYGAAPTKSKPPKVIGHDPETYAPLYG